MSTPSPPPCFAPKGFFCTDLHTPEHCPESWYCRGGLLLPAKCPDGKWSAVGSAYLADCGDRNETDLAVIVAIIIVFAGLSLCFWMFLDRSQVFGSCYPPQRRVCVFDPVPTAEVVYDDAGTPPGYAKAYLPGRPPARYFLIPRTLPPV